MSVIACERLAKEYADWLRDETISESADDLCVITAPFVDRHSDFLQIYVTLTDDGYSLSDDGYVIRDLRISGVTLDTERRKDALSVILKQLGVSLEEGELRVTAPVGQFAQAKHNLIQSMLAVGDLIHLAQPTVVAVFKEDVERYLRSKEVRFIPDAKLTGSSGLNHSFDFLVAGSKIEHYAKAINTPSRENVVELIFSWEDLRDVRPKNAVASAIVNDQERAMSRPLLDALDRYRIEVIQWSQREDQVGSLLG